MDTENFREENICGLPAKVCSEIVSLLGTAASVLTFFIVPIKAERLKKGPNAKEAFQLQFDLTRMTLALWALCALSIVLNFWLMVGNKKVASIITALTNVRWPEVLPLDLPASKIGLGLKAVGVVIWALCTIIAHADVLVRLFTRTGSPGFCWPLLVLAMIDVGLSAAILGRSLMWGNIAFTSVLFVQLSIERFIPYACQKHQFHKSDRQGGEAEEWI